MISRWLNGRITNHPQHKNRLPSPELLIWNTILWRKKTTVGLRFVKRTRIRRSLVDTNHAEPSCPTNLSHSVFAQNRSNVKKDSSDICSNYQQIINVFGLVWRNIWHLQRKTNDKKGKQRKTQQNKIRKNIKHARRQLSISSIFRNQ